MKKKMLPLLCFAVYLALVYLLLPLFFSRYDLALLFTVMPCLVLIGAIVFGAFWGLFWPVWILSSLLFLPSVFLYYNSSALYVCLLYGLLALSGNGMGSILYRLRK